MEKLKDYTTHCKDLAIEELNELKDNEKSVYMCDLGYELTQYININGTATYSTYEAKQYIIAWWNEAAEVYQYQVDNYGEALHNPFEKPDAFHVCMIIEGIDNLLSKCDFINDHWDDEILLTNEIIDTIVKQIKQVNEIIF